MSTISTIEKVYLNLYKQSLNKSKFKKLYNIIINDENILLAINNIKNNINIEEKRKFKKFLNLNDNIIVTAIKNEFSNFSPRKAKIVLIKKLDKEYMPVCIPQIIDRIIQQCILQVLEPICEAKFHNCSFGFRKKHTTENALAMMYRMINIQKNHYIVDINIENLFKNINHNKLLKQLWTIGIQDKIILSIISKILKTPIINNGVLNKGIIQTGLLFNLFLNIILNEFDWWISDQWETFESKHKYSANNNKFQALRRDTNLKEVYVIRYFDDIKIMCKLKSDAEKILVAADDWLRSRLMLKLDKNKSKIINTRKKYFEFIGFKIITVKKANKYIVNAKIKKDSINRIKKYGKKIIKRIQKHPTSKNIGQYNAFVLKIQNFYRIATHSNINFSQIGYYLDRIIKIRCKRIITKTGKKDNIYLEKYKGYNFKNVFINKKIIYPIQACKKKDPMCFSNKQKVINKVNEYEISYLLKNQNIYKSSEYNDNRMELYIKNCGKCSILLHKLAVNEFNCHHILPKRLGGTDDINNLIILDKNIHSLIHITNFNIINNLLNKLNLSKNQINIINNYRIKVGNNTI